MSKPYNEGYIGIPCQYAPDSAEWYEYQQGRTDAQDTPLDELDSLELPTVGNDCLPPLQTDLPTDKVGTRSIVGVGGLHSQGVTHQNYDDGAADKGRGLGVKVAAHNRAECITANSGLSGRQLWAVCKPPRDGKNVGGRPNKLVQKLQREAKSHD